MNCRYAPLLNVDHGVQFEQPPEIVYIAGAFFGTAWLATESRRPPVLRSARRPRICQRPADQSQTEFINAMSPCALGLPPDSAIPTAAATAAASGAQPCSSASVAMPAGVSVPAEPWYLAMIGAWRTACAGSGADGSAGVPVATPTVPRSPLSTGSGSQPSLTSAPIGSSTSVRGGVAAAGRAGRRGSSAEANNAEAAMAAMSAM